MIDKLKVGRYLELVTPAPVTLGLAVARVQELTRVVLNIAESESTAAPMKDSTLPAGYHPTAKFMAKHITLTAADMVRAQLLQRQRTSGVQVGLSVKAHRNFVWLEWLGGLVSTVESGGVDVLTGPMSGCWITAYTKGNKNYVAHVGTVMTPTDQPSIEARGAWNGLVAQLPPANRAGFRPMNDWVGPFPPAQSGEGAGTQKIFALVTPNRQFYSIITYPQITRASRIRIAGIQQLPDSLPANGLI